MRRFRAKALKRRLKPGVEKQKKSFFEKKRLTLMTQRQSHLFDEFT